MGIPLRETHAESEGSRPAGSYPPRVGLMQVGKAPLLSIPPPVARRFWFSLTHDRFNDTLTFVTSAALVSRACVPMGTSQLPIHIRVHIGGWIPGSLGVPGCETWRNDPRRMVGTRQQQRYYEHSPPLTTVEFTRK